MSDKENKLSAVMAKIEKTYGKGAAMMMGDNAGGDVESISTGSLSIDKATGISGLPKGRVVEVYGPES